MQTGNTDENICNFPLLDDSLDSLVEPAQICVNLPELMFKVAVPAPASLLCLSQLLLLKQTVLLKL